MLSELIISQQVRFKILTKMRLVAVLIRPKVRKKESVSLSLMVVVETLRERLLLHKGIYEVSRSVLCDHGINDTE